MRLPFKPKYQPGDLVIYCKPKTSASPGRRAKNILPSRYGETYSYTVDKYWVVTETAGDDLLVVRTRRGKELTLNANDPHLQHASLWQRFLHRHRFPTLLESNGGCTPNTGGAR